MQARFERKAPREMEARYRQINANVPLIKAANPRANEQVTAKHSSLTVDPNKLPRTALTSYAMDSDPAAIGKLRHTT